MCSYLLNYYPRTILDVNYIAVAIPQITDKNVIHHTRRCCSRDFFFDVHLSICVSSSGLSILLQLLIIKLFWIILREIMWVRPLSSFANVHIIICMALRYLRRTTGTFTLDPYRPTPEPVITFTHCCFCFQNFQYCHLSDSLQLEMLTVWYCNQVTSFNLAFNVHWHSGF